MADADETPRVSTKSGGDVLYRVGLGLKGVDGLVELLAGLVLWLAPGALHSALLAFAQHNEEGEGVRRLVAHWAGRLSESLGTGSSALVVVFLLSHGVIKLALVYCLLREYRWVYRPALIILALFALYQGIVLVGDPTLGKALLLALDLVIVFLVWREWRVRSDPAH